jgi:ABC-type nitrate/sulfonate/bicarbonate transport system ATPase subunit
MQKYNYNVGETIIKIKDVSLKLGGNQILRDINLEIKDITRPDINKPQGQIVSLVGPSGVGKSQLVKIISGLNSTDNCDLTGEVLLGNPLTPITLGQVGVVQQTYPLFEHRTVFGNLKVALRKLPRKERKDKIFAYLEHFGLADKATLYPKQLSGGQRQRVAIAQQLLSSEHFILLDEPFSGLDINMIDKTSEMIVSSSNLDELNTIVIVSHDIVSTCAISDTVWLMGKDKNPDGSWVAGARIKKEYDLMAAGLAWHTDIKDNPEFTEFVKEIRHEFKDLG